MALLEQVNRLLRDNERLRRSTQDRLGSGSGGSDGGGGLDMLKERVEKLEAKLDRVDDRLRSVEVGVGEIKGKIDGIAGQITVLGGQLSPMVAKLPSGWQMPAVIGATAGVIMLFFVLAKRFGAAF